MMLQRRSQLFRHPSAKELHNSLEYPIRRHDVPPVDAKRTVTPGKHDGTIGVQLECANAAQAEGFQPPPQRPLIPYHFTLTR